MFARTDMAEQKKHLIQALVLLVANLEKADILKGHLGVLGAKHVRYGVRDEHYDAVGECLLAAMAASAWARPFSAFSQLGRSSSASR